MRDQPSASSRPQTVPLGSRQCEQTTIRHTIPTMFYEKHRYALCAILLLAACPLGIHSTHASSSVSLEWNPVTTYEDGSPLTLGGYRLFYATSSLLSLTPDQATTLPWVTKLTLGTQANTTVSGLNDGTEYFFRLTALVVAEFGATGF